MSRLHGACCLKNSEKYFNSIIIPLIQVFVNTYFTETTYFAETTPPWNLLVLTLTPGPMVVAREIDLTY